MPGEPTSLNVTDVTRIAREAASREAPGVRVLGVTVGDRDGSYAEVIIDLEACRQEPCRLVVGIFRNASEESVREEISQHIARHVREHGVQP